MPFRRERTLVVKRSTFDAGDRSSAIWDHLIKDGTVERTYRKHGVCGVMALTGLKKSQAYALIGRAGLHRSVLTEKTTQQTETLRQEVLAARLLHLKETYDWIPGQEFCQLNGKVYSYENTFRLGGTILTGGREHFIAAVPSQSVVDFMVERGLKFFIINHKVEPVENFAGRKHAIALVPK